VLSRLSRFSCTRTTCCAWSPTAKTLTNAGVVRDTALTPRRLSSPSSSRRALQLSYFGETAFDRAQCKGAVQPPTLLLNRHPLASPLHVTHATDSACAQARATTAETGFLTSSRTSRRMRWR
jgi:hypothetical protein